MFTLLSKKVYSKETFHTFDKFYKLTLQFDGSMSKFIENMSGEKLKVQNIHSRQAKLETIRGETLSSQIKLKSEDIVIRYSQLTTPKLQELVFARSYWSKRAYDSIMAKNPATPIGFNLINQQIQTFRETNWIGESTIKLSNDFNLMGLSRSYSIKSNNQIICEVEQYFTPKFNRLFY